MAELGFTPAHRPSRPAIWRRSKPAVPYLNTVPKTIYKICDSGLWREAQRAGVFYGAPVDLRDGFIHFSTAEQVRDTAARHFAGAADLVLVAVGAAALGDALRWEVSRGGDLFPHLYGALPLDTVLWAKSLPLGENAQHVFPELVS
jgi:uncharacterized protein (DUF952 family)